MSKLKALFITVVVLFLCSKSVAAEEIGTVIAARGKVYAETKAGVKRPLKRRDVVYLNENVITEGDRSRAQVKLRDNTIVSIKPDTEYFVSDFILDKKIPENNKYVGNLVKGTLMSLSGQGKNSTHDNHRLKTPIVTIAVRGTSFGVLYEPSSEDVVSTVFSGDVSAFGSFGRVDIGSGNGFYMKGPDSAPVVLPINQLSRMFESGDLVFNLSSAEVGKVFTKKQDAGDGGGGSSDSVGGAQDVFDIVEDFQKDTWSPSNCSIENGCCAANPGWC